MSSYNPPTEDLPTFNSALFNQPEETLSQAEADLLYLSKTKTDISTAPQTTFNNQVYCPGGLSVGIQGVAGGLLQSNRRFRVNDANGNATGYLDITYGVGAEAVYTSQSLSLAQTFHRFYNCASGSATPVLRLEVGDTTKIFNTLEVGTIGGSAALFRTGIILNDLASPYSNYFQFYPNGGSMTYQYNGVLQATFHNFKASNNANANRETFKIGYDDVTIIEGVNLNARLIKSTTPASASHTLFDNMTTGGVLTIGNSASQNVINGVTTFNQNINAKADIVCFDKNSPFTNTLTINQTGSSAKYTTNAGTTTATEHRFTTYTTANVPKDTLVIASTGITILEQLALNTRILKSTLTNGNHYIFDNMVSGATLIIGGTASTNTINGNTTLPNTTTFGANTTISQSGSTSTMNQTSPTGTLEFKTRQSGTPTTPLTLTSTLITLAHSTRINSSLDLWDGGTLTKNATLQVLGVSGDFNISNNSSGGNIVLETTDGSGLTQPVTINSTETSIATKIKLTGTSYNVAFPSQQNLGYYLRQVGGSITSVVTNTYKTIYTTATQLGQGVWRIDWSVKNTITTGGTITSSQAFISTTSVDSNTPLVNTGAILRSHTSEVYGINDIQIVASSFTLTLITANLLYLTILKTFTTGAYSYIGEITATRIA